MLKEFALALIFMGIIGYKLGWGSDWSASAGKLPVEIIEDFYTVAYTQGRGGDAINIWYTPTTIDHQPQLPDRQNGEPIQYEIRRVVAQGLNVVVFLKLEATRGQPAMEIVEFFGTRNGRITERLRLADNIT